MEIRKKDKLLKYTRFEPLSFKGCMWLVVICLIYKTIGAVVWYSLLCLCTIAGLYFAIKHGFRDARAIAAYEKRIIAKRNK
jgi:hypothetical protein